MSAKSVFDLVVDESKLHPGFKTLLNLPAEHPARMMLDRIYGSFKDTDGNFLEQFQTTGFDARYFELYLFAYFQRTGFDIIGGYQQPDYIVRRLGVTVAVEATTTNTSTSGPLSDKRTRIEDLDEGQMKEYLRHELAIRFGSPLYSKLRKRYWELNHCIGMPFAIAVEAFHDKDSLTISDSALTGYVYGLDQSGSLDTGGELKIETTSIETHRIDGKSIPSNFFAQKESQNISAVLFTNSGTNAKFARMGYQHGYGCGRFTISRFGQSFSADPRALDSTFFSYNLDEPPTVEPWGQGLVVLHNPNALHPIPTDFFPHSVQTYIENDALTTEQSEWHPFSSKTVIVDLHDTKNALNQYHTMNWPRRLVMPISQREFSDISGLPDTADHPIHEEQGWFTDETRAFLGVVIRDRADNDWGYVILARDQMFTFRAIDTTASLPGRAIAVAKLQARIAEFLASPRRVFGQSD